MTISALDERTALIVIDLQAGTVGQPLAHPADELLARAGELAAAFRTEGLPVVVASVDSTPAGRTQYGAGARGFPAAFTAAAAGLEPQPSDIAVRRSTWSAFAGTSLDAQLRELDVSQVVLVGLATSFGVESTARAAYDLGYSVAIAVDAISDRSLEAHENSVARVFPALGEVGASAEVLALLAAR